jgi:deoxyxylulose-5-phosphate synthase
MLDRLIWNVSHQAYPHKILYGRRGRIRTICRGGGLSGFTRRVESEYDPFGAGQNTDVREHVNTDMREGSDVAILWIGPRLADCLKAADTLGEQGISVTVADARFAKPLDTAMIDKLAQNHQVLVTIEDGSMGGFAAAVMQHLAWAGLLDNGLKIRPMVLPDRFLEHDAPAKQWIDAGLTAKDVVETVTAALR